MNWLAHFLLAAPSPAFRVGSVLPDFSPAAVLATLPPAFQPGIAQHQQVDLFTDAHPVVRSGMRRFPPPFRRFGGILTDVFYDHFLTRNWADHTPVPLPAFAAQVYAAIEVCRTDLPPEIYARLARLREANRRTSTDFSRNCAPTSRRHRRETAESGSDGSAPAGARIVKACNTAFAGTLIDRTQTLAPSRLSNSALRSTPHR